MTIYLSRLLKLAAVMVGTALCQSAFPIGMPVFDLSNLLQSIQQTIQQVEQSKTQLNQYQTMLENSKSLDAHTWDNASMTMDNLMGSINTLQFYKQQAGGLDAYLSRYQTVDHYSNTPCFNEGSCSQAQLQAIHQQEVQASAAQKRANDAMLRGIDQQQTSMQADAHQLERLQQQAQGAAGQMQALQAANQLASAETNQLLQIRGLMVAEQNASATRAAAVADREAIQAAGDAGFRSGRFRKSSGKTW